MSRIGKFPAYDLEKSVSCIGAKAQPTLLSILSPNFKAMLVLYDELCDFLSSGIVLTDDLIFEYRRTSCANSVSFQTLPVKFEINLIKIMMSLMSVFCFENQILSDARMYNNIFFSKGIFILELLILNKMNLSKNVSIFILKMVYLFIF